MLTLRPYQQDLFAGIIGELKAGHRRVLAVLPTGGGKTVVSAALARRAREKQRSVWFLCHRDFLIEQTHRTFAASGVDHGFICAGKPMHMKPVMICSVDTLRARIHKLPVLPDMMTWDEAHHVRAAGWDLIMRLAGEGCIHIGVTATPERLDGKGLNPPFTAMVEGPTVRELMAMKYLAKPRYYAPSDVDVSEVHKVAGDFNQRELGDAVEKNAIVGDIVGHYVRLGEGRRMVYFCVNVAYSKRLAERFNAMGVPAAHVDAETPTLERIRAARAFAQGQLRVLTNCALFGEGYDLSAQAGMEAPIEGVGLVRPTMSLGLHLQQIGRALRPQKRPPLILDHVGNVQRHGMAEDDRDWSLEGRKKSKGQSDVKVCKAIVGGIICLAVNEAQAPRCEVCGTRFGTSGEGHERMGPAHIDGELTEIIESPKGPSLREEIRAAASYNDLVAVGARRGYKRGWAWHAWNLEKERRAKIAPPVGGSL